MIDIKSLTLKALKEKLTAAGEKPYRAGQIYAWLHKHLVNNFDEMTNLPLATRTYLKDNYYLPAFNIIKLNESAHDKTCKYLFELSGGQFIESVLMKYKYGNSVCISSQIGCRMGCSFCASTIGGLERSLTAGEMLEQIYAVTRHTGERVSHTVVMGMGEPLDNYDELISFIKILSSEQGLNISRRNITVSTCGLVPQIYNLADEALQINLSISLHAASDEKRCLLIPAAKPYPLDELLKACQYYFEKTGRRITYEYCLIENENDSPGDAKALAKLLLSEKNNPFHINLIPLNPVKERDFHSVTIKKATEFKNILEKYQINVTIRREMGSDIDGACGQLRNRIEQGGQDA